MERANGSSRSATGRGAAGGREESRAEKITSRGLRTTQDIKNLGLALAEDILSGSLSHKVAGPVVRSVTMTIRTAEFEHVRGNGHTVELGDSGCAPIDPDAALAAEEAALLEQLESIRKERAAR